MSGKEQKYEAALIEILKLVQKQQLPITSQVYRVAANALGRSLDELLA